jgi:dipeptidyl aminopeptidase/acylaminoacyl peptidase
LDEYSFKKNVADCPRNFLALPNPVPLLKAEGRTAIVWDTHRAPPSQIYLAVDGGVETSFAEGANGLKVFSGVHAGSRYEFRLYSNHDRRQPIETLQVSTQKPSAQLQISEVVFPANSARGSAMVMWHTTDGSPGRIYVSHNGGAEVLFAEGAGGAQNATWIVAGSRYQFRLYTASSGSIPAETVTIPAIKK